MAQRVQNSPLQPLINGLVPENTPKWLGNCSVTYRPALVEGLALTAGTSGVTKRPVNPQDQGYIPGYFLYTAVPLYDEDCGPSGVLSAQRRQHRQSAVLEFGPDRHLCIGMDRTFKFNTKVDF